MRRRIALLCMIVAGVAAPVAVAVTPANPAYTPVTLARTCSSGYVHAYLSWGEKCLQSGQFCKVGNREYRKYGFNCPSSGHLRRR
jgi:hypothetical protein